MIPDGERLRRCAVTAGKPLELVVFDPVRGVLTFYRNGVPTEAIKLTKGAARVLYDRLGGYLMKDIHD